MVDNVIIRLKVLILTNEIDNTIVALGTQFRVSKS